MIYKFQFFKISFTEQPKTLKNMRDQIMKKSPTHKKNTDQPAHPPSPPALVQEKILNQPQKIKTNPFERGLMRFLL